MQPAKRLLGESVAVLPSVADTAVTAVEKLLHWWWLCQEMNMVHVCVVRESAGSCVYGFSQFGYRSAMLWIHNTVGIWMKMDEDGWHQDEDHLGISCAVVDTHVRLSEVRLWKRRACQYADNYDERL
jgi:hypothetical protein